MGINLVPEILQILYNIESVLILKKCEDNKICFCLLEGRERKEGREKQREREM